MEIANSSDRDTYANDERIAIVGMSCLFPRAPNLAAFWTNIVNGFDAIRDATQNEWDPDRFFKDKPTSFEDIYCKRGGFITEFGEFDPLQYGVMPKSVFGSDPDQLLALKVAIDALADAGYDKRRHPNNTHEVILGRTSSPGAGVMNMIHHGHTVNEVMNVVKALNASFSAEQLSLLEEGLRASLNNCNSDTIPGVMPNVLAGRIAGRLGFKGRSLILDAACASSLVAVEIAVRDLLSGQCDLALAGGLHVNAFAVFYQMFCGLGALSHQQQIRPFDDKADGTILGEGLGMVVLKRLKDARRDGDRIYAVLCGIGSSSDGQGTSMLAPSAEGEALALSRAYRMAGIAPQSIELLEAHGTGTPSGDLVEMQAIEKIFGNDEHRSGRCALGSVKSMIGHTQAASGVAGLIKTALALYHRILPPTINVETPNRQVDWGRSACYINTQTRPWIKAKIHPKVPAEALARLSQSSTAPTSRRRAAISAFGFGGVNAHAILEEYDEESESELPSLIHQWETELCLFRGQTPSRLEEQLQQVATYLRTNSECSLRNVAYTLSRQYKNDDRSENKVRLAIITSSVSDLLAKIDGVLKSLSKNADDMRLSDVYFSAPSLTKQGKLAFVLPGLGSAYPNMLADLCFNFPDVRAVFDFVDQLAVQAGSEVMPSQKIFPRPFNPTTESPATLAAMDSAVVAVLMAEWALFTVLQNLGIKPDVLLGCSTGEFAALNMGGAVDILTAASMFYRISTTVARSISQDQLKQLRSIIVFSEFDQISHAIEGIENLYLSAAMSPTQTILSGSQDAIARAQKLLSGMAVQCAVLPMAIPYHTPLASGLLADNDDELTQLPLHSPTIPVWSCSQIGSYSGDVDQLRRATTELFTQSIWLKKTVEAMYEDDVRLFVEVGPKGVLTPLIKETLRGKPHVAVAADSAQGSSLTQLNRCLGELAAHGVSMNLDYLFARRSCTLIDFSAPSKPDSSQTIKLGLQYPEVRLSAETLRKVLSLNPPAQPSAQPVVGSPEILPSGAVPKGDIEQVDNGETVVQGYLSNMADFHTNLMSVHEQILSAYLTLPAEPSPSESDDQSLPLIRTGLVGASVDDGAAVAEILVTPSSHQYLLDHAIGGTVSVSESKSEKVYLMPLTVALEMMCELASTLMPGLRVIRLSEIRAHRRIRVGWKGCLVKVTVQRRDQGTVDAGILIIGNNAQSVNALPHMQCRIHFDAQFATAPPLKLPSDESRPPRLTRASLYTPQTMFHGPRMQSVVKLISSGNKVTSATVAVRPAQDWFSNMNNPAFIIDPLLLDNATQPVLFHLFEHGEDVSALLPFLSTSLDVYADLSALRCATVSVHACLKSVSTRGTEADVFLTDGAHNVLAKLSSISSRRIILSAEWKAYIAAPSEVYLSKPQENAAPADQSAAADSNRVRLPITVLNIEKMPEDDTTLNWCLDYVLNPTEFDQYYSLASLNDKRWWLAERITAKDACRAMLKNLGLNIAPCDIIIEGDKEDQLIAQGYWSQALDEVPRISISHEHSCAVASVDNYALAAAPSGLGKVS